MKPETRSEQSENAQINRLFAVFVGAAVSVFGLLLLTMMELEDFSHSAFSYWTPRAAAVVFVTTALGFSIRRRSVATRIGFGLIFGLMLALAYLWTTD